MDVHSPPDANINSLLSTRNKVQDGTKRTLLPFYLNHRLHFKFQRKHVVFLDIRSYVPGCWNISTYYGVAKVEPSTKVGETEKMWRPRRVVAGAGAIAYLVPFGASDVCTPRCTLAHC
ncbi:hypothetical protein AFLA_005704 [Aspergillus flavus NRRL3357]|nr:hypothetical protein AFLA_005704 [Aspergillus flavus NRRL3357]